MSAEANDLAMTSFSDWCRWVRHEERLQTKVCWPRRLHHDRINSNSRNQSFNQWM